MGQQLATRTASFYDFVSIIEILSNCLTVCGGNNCGVS